MTVFDDPWYAGIIDRFAPDNDDPNCQLAVAILASSCILAQAIDAFGQQIKVAADIIAAAKG